MKKRIILFFLCFLLLVMNFSDVVEAKGTDEDIVSESLPVPKICEVIRKGKGNTTIQWERTGGISGYQIQYATDSQYSDAKMITIVQESQTSTILSQIPLEKDLYFRMRSYQNSGSGKVFSRWGAQIKLIVWKSSWKYAKRSKIHSDPAILYYTNSSRPKNITIAINAGHGCKGGSSKKTMCHPDGSKKVTGGSTRKGAKYATAINGGTKVKGMSEASANLKIAQKLKENLLAAGYHVLMLRQDSDSQLDNIARTVMANNNADCHISIHFDSTSRNKGAFYISVPKNKSYRRMVPVKYNWKRHNRLGNLIIRGMKSSGIKIWKKGSMALDLTQTSYSTIASVDIEVGDKKTSTSDKNLSKIAQGIFYGVESYY